MRHADLRGRGFPVVLVLEFLLAPARFAGMHTIEHFGNHGEGVQAESAQHLGRTGFRTCWRFCHDAGNLTG